ncbi:hypothetical protein CAPTEDRAFT_180802 [Capitella teleta]|uniref:FERM domain-containing protein n=1 Tax=Capitella teleta TaxID=283909 RepID=R7TCX6_CAPTE|nr:hypothetical protein CAPTEDRAFT_180802 [Capitella teleta]|eukprot:ELT91322.1 hypothetical protein CAPTEDRAFT_180802 [Capitella teleta]
MLRNKFGKKPNKNYEDIHYSCTIRFLDDSEPLSVTFQKDTKGQWLVDHVCKELNLAERDYFGLRYVDSEKQRHWLDPLKPVYRQLKNVHPMVLCFRCKFYPTEPSKLKEEITRYFLFLQLRRDLHHGRLLCNPADANTLAAYIIQSEVGDYDPQDHVPGYVAQFKMLPKQTVKQEERIAEIHRTLSGQVPSDAEYNFLVKASSLDTYGVDPHPVKEKKHACGFKCPTFNSCKHLWKCAVEQQYFFTLSNATEAPRVTSGGGLFTRGSKFRFSGRCQKEVYTDSEQLSRDEPAFQRSSSNPAFVRSYNQQRTMSLPSKLRDKQLTEDMSDITIESNHVISTSANQLMEEEVGETVIPEEEEEVEEVVPPPSQEAAPVLAEPDVIPHADLDAQIQQLQTELEKCKVSRCTPPPDDVDVVVPAPVESLAAEQLHLQERLPVETPNIRDPDEPLPQRGISCCKALTIVFFFVFSAMLLIAFFVLESDLDFPVLKDIRQMPEVEDFKQVHYSPLKNTVAKKVGSFFKG